MTRKPINFKPEWISPPGDTILDLLDEFDWTHAELAKRMDYSNKHIHLLLQGEAPITEDTALRLEKTLGGSVKFWMTRELHYRQTLAEKEEAAKLEADKPWLKELPISYLLEHGLIQKTKNQIDRIIECLKFFGVASVSAWRKKYEAPLVVEFRSSQTRSVKNGAVATWLRYCEKEAENLNCSPYDKDRFKKQLEIAKQLTRERNTEKLIAELQILLAQSGVILVVKPTPPSCPVHGAAKWIGPDKALMMLSTRYKTDDQFWFSFFHESGHILLHGKRQLYIDGNFKEKSENEAIDKKEKEANRFAQDRLIPKPAAENLTRIQHTQNAITKFSNEMGIAPGIVVGRMQKDAILPWKTPLNKLKKRLF